MFSNPTPTIKKSAIREYDVTQNYFTLIHPKRREMLINLIDSYTNSNLNCN